MVQRKEIRPKTKGCKLSWGFILKCARLLNLQLSSDGTLHLSVDDQKADNPLLDYYKGDCILTLRCYDSGKCCNLDYLTGLCGLNPGYAAFYRCGLGASDLNFAHL